MTGSSSSGNKTGKMHECANVQSSCKRNHNDGPAAMAADKPDFDERESEATPDRKTSGPPKRRRRSLPPSSTPPSTPDVVPQEIAEPEPPEENS